MTEANPNRMQFPTPEERSAERARLRTAYEGEISCLKSIILQFENEVDFGAAIARYSNDVQTLSQHLNEIRKLFDRTIGHPANRVWPTKVEKLWLLSALATSLDGFASIVRVLQSSIPLPIGYESLRLSASNLRWITQIHHGDPATEEHEQSLVEDDLIENGGFPFVVDAIQLQAYANLCSVQPTNDASILSPNGLQFVVINHPDSTSAMVTDVSMPDHCTQLQESYHIPELNTPDFPTSLARTQASFFTEIQLPTFDDVSLKSSKSADLGDKDDSCFDGVITIDSMLRSVRRNGQVYKDTVADFMGRTSNEPWIAVEALLRAEGKPVDLFQLFSREQEPDNLRKIVETLRDALSVLDVQLVSVAKSTWIAVLTCREKDLTAP